MTTHDEESVREEIHTYLRSNFPQIAMHGGDASITALNLEDRTVYISLGGACTGCGISPMTIAALQNRLPAAIDAIDYVYASADDPQAHF
jgi:Fe-S cluster biogenesis protein NfuA